MTEWFSVRAMSVTQRRKQESDLGRGRAGGAARGGRAPARVGSRGAIPYERGKSSSVTLGGSVARCSTERGP